MEDQKMPVMTCDGINSNPVSEVVPSLDWKTDYRKGQLKGNNTIIDEAPKAGKGKKEQT